MSKSIRYYYFTSIVTVLVACILVMGIIQVWLSASYFRQEREIVLKRAVSTVKAGIEDGLIAIDLAADKNVHYMAEIAGASLVIADMDGVIVFTTTADEIFDNNVINAELLEKIDETGEYNELGKMDGFYKNRAYTIASPIVGVGGAQIGYVIASSDALGLKIYLTDMMSSFILSAGLVMLVASLLAVALTKRTVIPIKRVSEAARQFGEGNYSMRVPVEGDDELAQLAITFNEMARSFDATDRSRRSFMGNIAHELRTPMTTIKGFIDGMLDGTIPEKQRDKYLAIVSDEVGRLARLTKNMLDISRLESGEYVPDLTVFDIWGTMATVFISIEQRIATKNIELEGMQVYPPINVLADADFVYQVVLNLADNAVKFTEDNGKIIVSIEKSKTMVTVGVSNTGGNIPEESLEHVFDRFYKGDKSRGLNAAGSGLGLHICKVLVGLMGGKIWAESVPDEQITFKFTLPLASMPKNAKN